jgi:hypothetical protein
MTPAPQPDTEPTAKPWLQRHIRFTLGLALLALILLLLIVPPFISLSRYKSHITQLVSSSIGRPVRLSSVELRLLPLPGFVLTDLTVEEDPAYGAEPVLHANTVVASIRLLSLWRGRLALDRISVDEASLNLVRASNGHWNADSLFRTAAPAANSDTGTRRPLPYMEATNSRINVKFGAEKIPFSLTSTDASLWHEDDGWHIRLRGQPTRTDIPLAQADTGIVRLEATMRPASQNQVQLSQMPLHVDMDWRQAQLGQLSLLILGSDEDWRGDLAGELHADGTADALKVTTRLRTIGVHRAEFAPAAALDFDANCSFRYHYSARSPEKPGIDTLVCNSPIGDGRLHLTGSLPAAPAPPQLTLELDRVPAQAPLDLLRTLRGNLDQSLTAQGSLSGKMTYAPATAGPAKPRLAELARSRRAGKTPQPASALQGSFTALGVHISGEGPSGERLSSPIDVTNLLLSPALTEPDQPPSLAASLSVPAGASAPLAITAQLGMQGFDVAIRGAASLPRLRDLARAAGITQAEALGQISNQISNQTTSSAADLPASLDLHVTGPWLAPDTFVTAPEKSAKKLTGSIALRNAAWKPEFLAAPVDLASATLRFENGLAVWDGVSFAYGPAASRVRGTATLAAPFPCTQGQLCTPHFTVRFTALDAAALQAALLGARESGTLLSSLIDRFRPSAQPNWPPAQGTLQADSFTAGPFAFTGASAQLRVEPHGLKCTSFEARIFGGQTRGAGSLSVPDGQSSTQDSKPSYTLQASFAGVNPAQLGNILGGKWSGGAINGSGTLSLSGFAAADLASSAKGSLNFDWRNGHIAQQANSPLLAEFTRWNGTAKIEKSALTLTENQVHQNGRTAKAEGSLTFAQEPKLTLVTPHR